MFLGLGKNTQPWGFDTEIMLEGRKGGEGGLRLYPGATTEQITVCTLCAENREGVGIALVL